MGSVMNINSMLYIRLTATSGVIEISNEIPMQRFVIKQYGVHFDTDLTSNTNPDVVMLDIQPFTSSIINTNVPINGAIPLLCNTEVNDTIRDVDIPLDSDRSVVRQFEYRLVKADGTALSNFVSANLIMSYDNGVIYG